MFIFTNKSLTAQDLYHRSINLSSCTFNITWLENESKATTPAGKHTQFSPFLNLQCTLNSSRICLTQDLCQSFRLQHSVPVRTLQTSNFDVLVPRKSKRGLLPILSWFRLALTYLCVRCAVNDKMTQSRGRESFSALEAKMAGRAEYTSEDGVEYWLFPVIPDSLAQSDHGKYLEEQLDAYLAQLSQLLVEYIWQKDPFHLRVVSSSAAGWCSSLLVWQLTLAFSQTQLQHFALNSSKQPFDTLASPV